MLPINNVYSNLTSHITQIDAKFRRKQTNLCTLTAFMMDDEYEEEEDDLDSGEYPDLMTPS